MSGTGIGKAGEHVEGQDDSGKMQEETARNAIAVEFNFDEPTGQWLSASSVAGNRSPCACTSG
jgi:hypothetical protein